MGDKLVSSFLLIISIFYLGIAIGYAMEHRYALMLVYIAYAISQVAMMFV